MGTETSKMEPLTDQHRAVLELERYWWKYAGAKEQTIRDLFDMSATRYYQVLNAVLEMPAAEVYDAQHVRRLRAVRDRRRHFRETAEGSVAVQVGRWAAPRTP